MNHATRLKLEVLERQMKAAMRYYARQIWRAVWYPLCDASEMIDHFDSHASVWLRKRRG